MQAEIDRFIELNIKESISDEVRAVIISLYKELLLLKNEKAANEKINTEMAIQYNDLIKENEELKKELSKTKILLSREVEKNSLKNKAIYGSHTEKLASLANAAANKNDDIYEDEALVEDEANTDDKSCKVFNFSKNNEKDNKDKAGENNSKNESNKSKKGKRIRGLKASLDKLPQEYTYLYDIDELNALYGENNWRIVGWHLHRKLAKLPVEYYTQNLYTPVISYNSGDCLSTVSYCNPLVDKSYLSESLIADMLYRKYILSLPCTRQSADLVIKDIALPKQTMIRWINKVVPPILTPVFEYMLELLISYGYIQSDESYIKVNHNERESNSKGYMWIHTSSELLDFNPIALFFYEPTRNTDHLRNVFGDFLGYMTCDAYVSYRVLEEENEGIYTSGCMMHLRRYFAVSFFLNDIEKLSDEELASLPETKALLLIRDIYAAEKPLKSLKTSERLARRDTDVRPKVDTFFRYIHELDDSEEVFSERLTKAINYAVNQEKYLRRFLEDGNIPCDNGKSERLARSFSVGRSNWLFADTVKGAKVNALVYSVTETAKANGVNVMIYLQYLFEKIPPMLDKLDSSFMESMMPWSNAYHEYEAAYKKYGQELFNSLFPKASKPPSRPKKTQVAEKLNSNLSIA